MNCFKNLFKPKKDDLYDIHLKQIKIKNASQFNRFKFKNVPLYYTLDLSNLKKVQLIPMGYKSVDPDLSEIILNKDIHVIGDGAFEGCSNLEKVECVTNDVNGSPSSVGNKAFYFCLKLNKFPFEYVEELSSSSFEYTHISSFKANGKLETIPESCFANCYFLKDINLGNVKFIEHHAFELTTLSYLVLPKTLKKIGNFAFKNCDFLENIVCFSEEPPAICENTFVGSPIKHIWVASPEAAVKYMSCKHWSKYSDKIKVLDLSKFNNEKFFVKD